MSRYKTPKSDMMGSAQREAGSLRRKEDHLHEVMSTSRGTAAFRKRSATRLYAKVCKVIATDYSDNEHSKLVVEGYVGRLDELPFESRSAGSTQGPHPLAKTVECLAQLQP